MPQLVFCIFLDDTRFGVYKADYLLDVVCRTKEWYETLV